MKVYVDATTLIAFGDVGRLELLEQLDGEPQVLRRVADEVTLEPAATNLQTWVEDGGYQADEDLLEPRLPEARDVLDEPADVGDVWMVAAGLSECEVAVVSDDRRLRTVCRGFGASVTGTYGVVVRAVAEGLPPEEAKDVVREIDGSGLHSTAELREKVFELIEEAAN